jgi:hypothetical protein
MQTKIANLKPKMKNGITPAMATPLLADGYTVNTAVIPSLVNFLLNAGVNGLFIGGTTGEGILLTEAERDADGHVPCCLRHEGRQEAGQGPDTRDRRLETKDQRPKTKD